MVTKLAPERMTGMVMGLWFLSIAGANFLAGQIAAVTGASDVTEGASPIDTLPAYSSAYLTSAWVIFGATVLLLLLVPLLKKWMHGVK
jgi:POT family proton-dependent oligopeptide transporter